MKERDDDNKPESAAEEAEPGESDGEGAGRLRRAKLWVTVALVLAIVIGGYLVAAHLSGGALFTFGLPLGGEERELRRITLSFLEDIQFKDYEEAATYHSPEKQETVDIPYLMRRLFKSPPETLDIMEYEILWVDLDSSGTRARVRTRLKAKHLPSDQIREANAMIYFTRETKADPWYMILEDSLRRPQADPNKRH